MKEKKKKKKRDFRNIKFFFFFLLRSFLGRHLCSGSQVHGGQCKLDLHFLDPFFFQKKKQIFCIWRKKGGERESERMVDPEALKSQCRFIPT